jgi:hypothetical protein
MTKDPIHNPTRELSPRCGRAVLGKLIALPAAVAFVLLLIVLRDFSDCNDQRKVRRKLLATQQLRRC